MWKKLCYYKVLGVEEKVIVCYYSKDLGVEEENIKVFLQQKSFFLVKMEELERVSQISALMDYSGDSSCQSLHNDSVIERVNTRLNQLVQTGRKFPRNSKSVSWCFYLVIVFVYLT